MHMFWELFGDAPLAVKCLGLLQLAFTIWMIVDAYQRRVDTFWLFGIFFFQPIGAWAYFFAVKLPTLRLPARRSGWIGERKLSLDELHYHVDRTPTVANRLAYSERLMEVSRHAEAIPHLQAVLAIEPGYCAALHFLAECQHATGASETAIATLRKLIDRDYRWSNYRALRTLIDVHRSNGHAAEALAACRELERHVPTLECKCLLAEQLLGNDIPHEAAKILDLALRDYQFAPLSTRWRNWRLARTARKLLTKANDLCGPDQGMS